MLDKRVSKVTRLFIVFLFSLFFYTFSIAAPLKNSKELKTGVLNNGITYYIYKNEYPKNKVFMNLVVNTGSLNENSSEGGTAHFLEHMAFNGTNLYPKNDLVKYLQSIGLKFGDDLNAYTSYGETVYSLDTPSTEQDIKKCLQILNEWAFNINLNQEDVKDEKNIIVEEWRLQQGLKFRISDLKRKALFGDSLFYNRLPIGTLDSISSTTPERLKEYYKRLYTPDRMAVIVVGDFNSEEIENQIKLIFSNVYTGSEIPKEKFNMPKTKNQTIIFRDKEVTTTTLSLSYSDTNYPLNTKVSIKEALIKELFFNIFNNRFNMMKKKENSPFISGGVYSYTFTKGNELIELVANIKENQLEQGYKELMNLLKIGATYPPYSDELEREKKDLISSLKLILNNKNAIDNQTITDEIKDTFLLGDSFFTIEDEYMLVNEILVTITPGDILNFAKIFYNSEKVKFLTISDSEIFKDITSESLEKIEKEIISSSPFNFSYISNKELEKINLKEGDILSKKILNENTSFKEIEYVLSNNIKVLYKKTDFENDKIYINFFKKEGTSVNNKKEYFNAQFVPYMMSKSGVGNLSPQEFEQFLKGKNFNFSINLDDYTQGIEIISDNENLENALNTLDSLVVSPRFDDVIFKSIKEIYEEKIINQENSPNFQFNKALASTFFKNDYRRMPLTIDNLALVNKEEIIKLYKEKFSNFNDFNLIIIGAVDENLIEKLLKRYFASLPSEKIEKTLLPLNITLEKKEVTSTVVKGEDEKAKVTLLYPYNGTYNNNNRNLYNAFSSLLNIILIEKIRESSAQVYSIYSTPHLEYTNYNENYMTVNFSTDYKKVDEVITNVKKSIEEISQGKYDKKKLNDIIENYRINYDTQLKMNQFWYVSTFKKMFSGDENYSVLSPEEYSKLINYENLTKFSTENIYGNNSTTIILKPEKTK